MAARKDKKPEFSENEDGSFTCSCFYQFGPNKGLVKFSFLISGESLNWIKRVLSRGFCLQLDANSYPTLVRWLVPKKAKCWALHRLIACSAHGKSFISVEDVDHKNGRVSDARIENLRFLTRRENNFNRLLTESGKVLPIGVCKVVRNGGKLVRWKASFLTGDFELQKTFLTPEEAVAQRTTWENENGYSEINLRRVNKT